MSEPSPYQQPQADLTVDRDDQHSPSLLITPRVVPMARAFYWFEEGFGYFRRNPWSWMATMLLGVVFFIILNITPIVNIIVSLLTTYIWVAGLAVGCFAQDQGKPFQIAHLLAGFSNEYQGMRLALLSLLAFIINLVVILGAGYVLFYNELVDGSLSGSLDQIPPEAINGMVAKFSLLILLYIPLTLSIVFASYLIAIHKLGVIHALKLGFSGGLKNSIAIILYSLISLILLVISCIPLFLGLFVFMPVLYASLYSAYKDIFIGPLDVPTQL